MKAWITAVPYRMPYVEQVVLPGLRMAGLDVTVIVDEEYRGAKWGSLRAWEAMVDEDVALMAQDDIILHPELPRHLPDVVDAVREKYENVSLFCPDYKWVREGVGRGEAYVERPRGQAMVWMQANVYRGESVARMLEWYASDAPERITAGRSSDALLGEWLKVTNAPSAYCSPALVDHLNTDSAQGNRTWGRWSRVAYEWKEAIPPSRFSRRGKAPGPVTEAATGLPVKP